MSADALDHDALITQFTGLTGVAAHEVSSLRFNHSAPPSMLILINTINRLNNISQQTSGIYPAQPPSTIPPLKKPPKHRHYPRMSQTHIQNNQQLLAVIEL